MPSAWSSTSIDDDRVRITTWTFRDGENTGHHRHEYDYVIVPISGGFFVITESSGATREMTQKAGVAYLGRAGTEHDVINRSGDTAVFVEVELKR
jgi:quercetin dioxygenase-like cupin family protein